MMRRISGLVGLAIFIIATCVAALLLTTSQQARARDHTNTRFGVVSSGTPLCVWEVALPQRVLAEDNSQFLVVNATDPAKTDCQSSLTLLAPGFDISPHKEEQILTAKSQGSGSIFWIVTPHKPGSYEIALSDGINTRVLGVTVTNLLGLTALQAQILTTLGTLLGPVITIPWWLERWQQRKRVRLETPAQSPP